MNGTQFATDALRTESKPETLAFSKGGTLTLLKLLVLSAEVADTCKRAIFYGKPLDSEKLVSKLYALDMASSNLRHAANTTRLTTPEDQANNLTAPNLRLLHAAIGIFGESGEMLEALVEQIETGTLDLVNMNEELGDCYWYQAVAHDEIGSTPEQAWEGVIAKLQARYPGKFSSELATTRDLDAERAILEQQFDTSGK